MSAKWSDKGTKTSAVAADTFMMIDSEDGTPSTTNKLITKADIQKTLVTDVDAQEFSLQNVLNITANQSYTFSDGTTQQQAAIPDGLTGSVTTAVFLQSESLATQDNTMHGVFFRSDGLKLYTVGIQNDSVYEYDLTTPWDISTISFNDDFLVSAQDDTPRGVCLRYDGLKMYVTGAENDSVYEYDLSTAWDITTAAFLQSFSIITQDNNAHGIFFHPDGLKMYVTGSQNDSVYEYDLSTAWDVTSSVFLQSFSVTSDDNTPTGLFFRSDGIRMYVVGVENDEVIEYKLSTAWDISTSILSQVFSVANEDTIPTDVFFRHDGLKMYVTGTTSDSIHEYDLGIKVDGIIQGGGVILGSRIQETQGANIASASAITVGDGNTFLVTGTTAIDTMTSTGWQFGSKVTLYFNSNITINNAITADAFQLAGGVAFSATAGASLTVVFINSINNHWREVCRTVGV